MGEDRPRRGERCAPNRAFGNRSQEYADYGLMGSQIAQDLGILCVKRIRWWMREPREQEQA